MKPLKNLLPKEGEMYDYGKIFSSEENVHLLEELVQKIPWKADELFIFGKKIISQRKVAWYGDEAYEYTYSHQTKRAIAWLPILKEIKNKVEVVTGECYNSCLANLYETGRVGMGWHSDDEKTIARDSAIASVSLGACRRFVLKNKRDKTKIELALEGGSLLLMKGCTQRFWLHSLPKTRKPLGMRVNLTFRKFLA